VPKWYNTNEMRKKQARCRDCGFLGVQYLFEGCYSDVKEVNPQVRLDIHSWIISLDAALSCARRQEYEMVGQQDSMLSDRTPAMLKNIDVPRNCSYFFPYSPGYIPGQHLELQRERDQRNFLIKVSAISAVVGAGIATLVNLVWS